MNIQLLTPQYPKYNSISPRISSPSSELKLSVLHADTVSFSGKDKTVKMAVHSLSEAFSNSYDDGIVKSKKIAKRFMDTISSVASEVEGLEFYRELYEGKVIKGKDSFLSKLIRSGAAPLDQIRTTVFIKDLYDMSILTNFLKKMSDRDYEVMMIPAKRNGRKVLEWQPDLDIRLNDVPEKEIKKLPKIYRECVSKRLPSGLSDIQIRFVDKLSPGEKKPLEVIIMFGKESGKAKIIEEDDVYNYLRKLKNELHVSQVTDYDSKSPIKRIKDNISIIKDTLHSSISRPMYDNAAAKDTENLDLGLTVGLKTGQGKIITGFLEEIRGEISKYYQSEIQKVKSEEYRSKLQKLIKSTPEYKEREDKTVYVEDIINMKKDILKNLKINKEEDMQIIVDVQRGLQKTIEKYTLEN